jgi:hypothetical protein
MQEFRHGFPSAKPVPRQPDMPFDDVGALGEIRTPDPRIRSPMLYPAELRAHETIAQTSSHLASSFSSGSKSSLDLEAMPGSGDLPPVLELKFQFLDQLGQPLSRERIGGLQRQSPGLCQLPLEFVAVFALHGGAPAR